MAIDDLLGDMHRDRMTVTTSLQEKINGQRRRREEASKTLITTLERQIKELREQEHLLEANGGMADLRLLDRLRIAERRMEKELSLAHEAIQLTRDAQATFNYELHLTREQLEEEQDYEQMQGVFYES